MSDTFMALTNLFRNRGALPNLDDIPGNPMVPGQPSGGFAQPSPSMHPAIADMLSRASQAPQPTSFPDWIQQIRQAGQAVEPLPAHNPFLLFHGQNGGPPTSGFPVNHPFLAHLLEGGLIGAAGVPAAPLVSGAGSGISRAIQGGLAPLMEQRQNALAERQMQQHQTQTGSTLAAMFQKAQEAQSQMALQNSQGRLANAQAAAYEGTGTTPQIAAERERQDSAQAQQISDNLQSAILKGDIDPTPDNVQRYFAFHVTSNPRLAKYFTPEAISQASQTPQGKPKVAGDTINFGGQSLSLEDAAASPNVPAHIKQLAAQVLPEARVSKIPQEDMAIYNEQGVTRDMLKQQGGMPTAKQAGAMNNRKATLHAQPMVLRQELMPERTLNLRTGQFTMKTAKEIMDNPDIYSTVPAGVAETAGQGLARMESVHDALNSLAQHADTVNSLTDTQRAILTRAEQSAQNGPIGTALTTELKKQLPPKALDYVADLDRAKEEMYALRSGMGGGTRGQAQVDQMIVSLGGLSAANKQEFLHRIDNQHRTAQILTKGLLIPFGGQGGTVPPNFSNPNALYTPGASPAKTATKAHVADYATKKGISPAQAEQEFKTSGYTVE